MEHGNRRGSKGSCATATAVLLEQDELGKSRFDGLTPGKQRTLIYSISAVKNPQLRVDRAIRYIENLKKQPKGKESISRILT